MGAVPSPFRPIPSPPATLIPSAEPTRLDLLIQEIERVEALEDYMVDGTLVNNILQRLPRLEYLGILCEERDKLLGPAAVAPGTADVELSQVRAVMGGGALQHQGRAFQAHVLPYPGATWVLSKGPACAGGYPLHHALPLSALHPHHHCASLVACVHAVCPQHRHRVTGQLVGRGVL